MMNLNKRRIGKFTVSKELYDESDITKMGQFFSLLCFIPIKVEFIYAFNNFELQGISKYFDYINFGDEIPSYEITLISNDDNDILGISVEKSE